MKKDIEQKDMEERQPGIISGCFT